MVELNLLPDVKQQYVKARRRKQSVIAISVLVSAVCLAIMIALLIFVRVGQKQHINALNKDIDAAVATLKETQDLDKILTIQNQLASLPALHDDKKITSRLFGYLNNVTPKQATISDAVLDFDTNTLNISGNADSLGTVNKFADTLKFTTFKVEGENPQEGKAFSNVVLKSFTVEEDSSSGKISYELEMNFDEAIFVNEAPGEDGKSPVTLTVPNIISTRSATQSPSSLFAPKEESQ